MFNSSVIRRVSVLALTILSASVLFAQAPPATPVTPSAAAVSLPGFVYAGASFNQSATPRASIVAGAVYQVSTPVTEYMATTANVIPIKTVVAGKSLYTFQTTVQQSAHKLVYNVPDKFSLLFGAGAGVALSSPPGSGTTANLAASGTVTMVFHLSKKWGIAIPVEGLYTPQLGWALVPSAVLVYKPGSN